MSQIPSYPSSRTRGQGCHRYGRSCAGKGMGNGRAISIMLAEDGCNVLCLGLNFEWAHKIAQMSTARSQKVKALPLKSDFGRLDILANIAGIGGAAKDLEINVRSMKEGEIRGSIGGTLHLLHPTSKGAVVNMTRAIAAHHASDGIRVNCACPGMLYTPMMYAGGMNDEAHEARRKIRLLGSDRNGWDAAYIVTFLASDHARWITGAILPVDAGSTVAVGIGMPKSASVNG
ncbi:NAD(P)-binding protein [Macroventuria anomochaeta]|uniref:NAD(P)-binding protein n=1 Tax=Macroventuria anomochaeta TaxID=301207 RepID=A0ACB6RS45_9PLEO|nr:NAD(P)-binding protein [Macroventuria anomochaeta]KAF2623969.1 NAD(P)-binding protein [Macroventuria anomochaeta]